VYARGILVECVGSDAVLRRDMHGLGTQLQLDALVARADDRGVDRAVAVLLRRRDVVLEATGHGAPVCMDEAERAVAVLDAGADHAKAVEIGELLERYLAVLHLPPDRVGLLFAPGHFGSEIGFRQLRHEILTDLLDESLVVLVQTIQPLAHCPVSFWMKPAESKILELLAHGLHAHAARERRVDLERLLA